MMPALTPERATAAQVAAFGRVVRCLTPRAAAAAAAADAADDGVTPRAAASSASAAGALTAAGETLWAVLLGTRFH